MASQERREGKKQSEDIMAGLSRLDENHPLTDSGSRMSSNELALPKKQRENVLKQVANKDGLRSKEHTTQRITSYMQTEKTDVVWEVGDPRME